MHKLSIQRGDLWVEHSHPPEYQTQITSGGTERLVAGVPAGDSIVIKRLTAELPAPFFLLYVLHTTRGEGEPGRYQSPEIDHAGLDRFLSSYGPLLSGDSRHDFWVYSPDIKATLVWDRHNLLYAYGPIDEFVQALRALGFNEGNPNVSFGHLHHYRQEFDADAKSLLAALPWVYSPLRPEDEQ